MNQFQIDPTFRFSRHLKALRLDIQDAPAKQSLRQVISFFGPKGHCLLTLFFVLPFLQPIPIPGLSTVLGICICFFGVSLLLNRPPWLPDRLARIHVEKKFLLRVTGALESLLKKVEHVVRPRSQSTFAKPRVRAFHGFLIAWHAFLLALPLPVPFSNMIPAVCLLLIALGELEEDFAVIALGYLMALLNTAFFTALVVAPFLIHRSAHV
jgi:hypothetical protein